MTSELIINVSREESRVALLEGGQVVELYIERKKDTSLVGNVYKGRVLKILPGMQSSFIDIGLEKAAFLYVSDIMPNVDDYYAPFMESDPGDTVEMDELQAQAEAAKPLPIEELIQEGQEILVQVAKDPMGTKGARDVICYTAGSLLRPDAECGACRHIPEDREGRDAGAA